MSSLAPVPVAEPSDPQRGKCGKRTRSGGRCGQAAGWGTDHPGVGPCKLHGGATPIRHGRYSVIKREQLRELVERFEADPDPLNLLSELAAARALFVDFIDRFGGWRDALLAWYAHADRDPPSHLMDISDAYRLLDLVSKIVERIEKIRSANAISRPELLRLMTEMARVVEAYVPDEVTRQRIRDGWLSIRLA